jgi:hypothetical protein
MITRELTSFIPGAVVFYLYWNPRSVALLRSAFGLESKVWLGVWAVAAVVIAYWLSFTVALRAYVYMAVKVYKVEPLVEPSDAGILDIPYWSSVAVFASVVTMCLGIAPGAQARWRPVVIVFFTAIGSALVAGQLTAVVAKAIYGPSVVRRAITRKQCAKRYIGGRQCSNWTFRWGDVCRWHLNAIETAQRYGQRIIIRQTLGACWLCFGLFVVTKFIGEIRLFWATLAIAVVGAGIRLIAEGIIAPYYVFSQLTIWPKAQALGLVLQSAGATALLFVVGVGPETARTLVVLLSSNQVWLAFGPGVVYVAFAMLAIVAWDLLIARVLHYQTQTIASIVLLVSLAPPWNMLIDPLLRYSRLGR